MSKNFAEIEAASKAADAAYFAADIEFYRFGQAANNAMSDHGFRSAQHLAALAEQDAAWPPVKALREAHLAARAELAAAKKSLEWDARMRAREARVRKARAARRAS